MCCQSCSMSLYVPLVIVVCVCVTVLSMKLCRVGDDQCFSTHVSLALNIYNEIHNGPSPGAWACEFTDHHMPITFDLFTLFPLAVIGKGYLMKMCWYVCRHYCLVMILHSIFNRWRS